MPKTDALARDYEPTGQNVRQMLAAALDKNEGRRLLEGLLKVEAEIVKAARDAGKAMAAFRKSSRWEPARAVAALARFGERMTDAFHGKVRSRYGTGTIRPLGSLLFVEGARAMLSVTVLKPGADFRQFQPAPEDVLIGQRLFR